MGSHTLWLVESADDWACGSGDCANKGTLYVKAIGNRCERGLKYSQLSVHLPPLFNKFQHQ